MDVSCKKCPTPTRSVVIHAWPMRCKEWSVLLLDVTFFLIHSSSFGNSQFQYDINIYRKHNDRGQK